MVWPTDYDTKMGEYNVSEPPGMQLASTHAHSSLDHLLKLSLTDKPSCQRLTGIMASMGTSTHDIDVMEKMMAAGMNIARIDMSIEGREYHLETLRMLRQAVRNYSLRVGKLYPLAVAIELVGQTVKTGTIADTYGKEVELKAGEVVRLTTDEAYKEKCSSYTVFVDLQNVADLVRKGDAVLIDRELIQLRVELVSASTLTCKVERGGQLKSNRTVFFPGVAFDECPSYTEKDKSDVDFAVKEQVDILIAPFARNALSMTELREMAGERGRKIALVAKIQTFSGYQHLDEILAVSNGILISRLDLGSDISPKKLIIAQKNIIARANKANVACCVGAQLLSSMFERKIPLRSEVLDVSNCVIDGADCLLLGAGIADGLYPVEAVAYQSSICKEAEACIWTRQIFADLVDKTDMPCDPVTGTALGAVLAAQRSLAAAIVVVTTSGRSAQLVAKYRPRCPIMAVTRYSSVARQLQLWRGVLPLVYEDTPDSDWQLDVEQRVNFCLRFAVQRGFVRVGDPVVLVTGWRHGSGFTNTMRIVYTADDTINRFCVADTPDSDWQLDVEQRVNFCLRFAVQRGFVRVGDPVVLVTGWRHGSGFTNTMRIVYTADDTTNLF